MQHNAQTIDLFALLCHSILKDIKRTVYMTTRRPENQYIASKRSNPEIGEGETSLPITNDQVGNENAQDKKWYTTSVAKIAAVGVALAATFGAGGVIMGGRGEAETPTVVEGTDPVDEVTQADEAEIKIPEARPEEANENETTTEPMDNEEATTPETPADPEFTPILMGADTPAGLFDQFKHNQKCVFNAPEMEMQLECVRYLTGDGAGGGLTNSLHNAAREAYTYRLNTDPSWQSETVFEVLDSTIPLNDPITDNMYEMQFVVSTQDTPESPIGHQQLRFVRSQATTVTQDLTLDPDIEDKQIWLFQSRTNVEPGTQLQIGQ